MIRLAALFMFLAHMVSAGGIPGLYDVTGVKAGDALNVRAGAGTGAAVIGQLQPGARDIEVVAQSEDGKWGQINLGETSGWVSLRYLRARGTAAWPPARMRCFGTEPFWSFDLAGDSGKAVFKAPDVKELHVSDLLFGRSMNRTDRFNVTGPGTTAVIAGGACSDGMSDRNFALRIDLLLQNGPPRHYSGCCTLAP